MLTGDNVLNGGFIITGGGNKRVLIRGLGPSLAGAGVDGALADPLIALHSSATGEILMSNDNWKNNQQDEIAATGLAPADDLEAALVITLAPGAYTVIKRGKLETTGIGLLEVYDLGAGVGPELANISTRGFVATGSNVMIAGFIVANSANESDQVIVRGLGPSLGAFGITNPLADPVLELHDINGALLASNDNWKDTQQTEIEVERPPAHERRRSRDHPDPRRPAPTPPSRAAKTAAPASAWSKFTICIEVKAEKVGRGSLVRAGGAG